MRKTVVEYSPTISSPDDQNVNEDWRTGESSTQVRPRIGKQINRETKSLRYRKISNPSFFSNQRLTLSSGDLRMTKKLFVLSTLRVSGTDAELSTIS